MNQVEESTPQRVAFSEILRKLEDCKMCTSDYKVLKLSDVMREYLTRLQELGAPKQDQSVHSTPFKDKLLASIPGLSAYANGREVLLAFDNSIAQALSENLERERDCKIMSLARAAKIVRDDMFNNSNLFNGTFSQALCQQSSVSPSLLTLVKMILVGTNEQSHEQGNQQAALFIAQLMKFNSIKHGRRSTDGSVRHSRNQETPLPYIGISRN